jgi:hypothetical protein
MEESSVASSSARPADEQLCIKRIAAAAACLAWQLLCALQVRHLPDVRVLIDFGPHGVTCFPGSRMELLVEVTPRSYGIICTLLMLDFGEHSFYCIHCKCTMRTQGIEYCMPLAVGPGGETVCHSDLHAVPCGALICRSNSACYLQCVGHILHSFSACYPA